MVDECGVHSARGVLTCGGLRHLGDCVRSSLTCAFQVTGLRCLPEGIKGGSSHTLSLLLYTYW